MFPVHGEWSGLPPPTAIEFPASSTRNRFSYWLKRKNTFPAGGETVMLLLAPSSEMVKPLVVQLVVLKSEFCCNVQLVKDEGHQTATVLVAVSRMVNSA